MMDVTFESHPPCRSRLEQSFRNVFDGQIDIGPLISSSSRWHRVDHKSCPAHINFLVNIFVSFYSHRSVTNGTVGATGVTVKQLREMTVDELHRAFVLIEMLN